MPLFEKTQGYVLILANGQLSNPNYAPLLLNPLCLVICVYSHLSILEIIYKQLSQQVSTA